MVKHKQFVGNLPTNCLSVFEHFVGLAFKGLFEELLHLRMATLVTYQFHHVVRSAANQCRSADKIACFLWYHADTREHTHRHSHARTHAYLSQTRWHVDMHEQVYLRILYCFFPAVFIYFYSYLDQLSTKCGIRAKPLGCFAEISRARTMPVAVDSHRGPTAPQFHGPIISWKNYKKSLNE